VSRSPHSILCLLAALLPAAGCTGTEGTLVVRHDAAAGAPAVAENPYVPATDVRWFAQLDGAVDVEQSYELFYLDPQQQDAAALAALQARGGHYLCYLSAGSVEDFRADAKDFPDSAIGNVLNGFPNEHWLDVRDPTVRELMARRVTALAAQGCAGIPPSSLAVHAADTGFDLTLTDALDYARWLAERIHAAGMSAGLTGPAALTRELWPTFDFGLAIGCVNGSMCAEYAPFTGAKKTVLHIELGDQVSAPDLCNAAKALGFTALVSDPGFTGRCIACSDLP
jgi:Glycoside-hydrolase family GH114